MSVPFGRAVLTLDDITKQIRRTFEQLPICAGEEHALQW